MKLFFILSFQNEIQEKTTINKFLMNTSFNSLLRVRMINLLNYMYKNW
jgi:hypothetical protein